jgi:F-box domain
MSSSQHKTNLFTAKRCHITRQIDLLGEGLEFCVPDIQTPGELSNSVVMNLFQYIWNLLSQWLQTKRELKPSSLELETSSLGLGSLSPGLETSCLELESSSLGSKTSPPELEPGSHNSKPTTIPLETGLCTNVEISVPALSSAQLHNYTNSHLHNLPTELILEIADWLSPVARLRIQRVCSRFRACLTLGGVAPGIKNNILTEFEISQFVFLLRRDRERKLQNDYNQKCDLALPESELFRLGCSDCRVTHEIQYFSQSQLSLPPKTRVCKGLEGYIKLCAHYSFRGRCLLRGLREMGTGELLCEFRFSDDCFSDEKVRLWGRERPCLGFHNGHTITIDRRIPVFSIASETSATHEALSTALNRLDVHICPHLRSGDPELFDGKRMTAGPPSFATPTKDLPNMTYEDTLWCIEDFPGKTLRVGHWAVWSRCPNKHCSTCYCLRRICNGLQEDLVIFEYSSDMVGGPTDPSWLAQVYQSRTRPFPYESDGEVPVNHLTNSVTFNRKKAVENGVFDPTANHGTLCGGCKGQCCLYKYDKFVEI